MKYQDFIASKKKVVQAYGFHVDADSLNPMALPWQRAAVAWAVQRGRAALFEECGLGKTFQQLLWAEQVVKHTGGAVTLLCPIGVRQQTIREAEKFGIGVKVAAANEQSEVVGPGVFVTNYEKLHKFNASHFVGVVLDESSCLKEFKSKTRRDLCEKFKQTPYRLACTATPAPNEWMELGNHCEFLGVMASNEMLARWFINDTMRAGEYKLLDHAAADYWQWVCGWALCLSKPSDMGPQYSDDGFVLPEINYHVETLAMEIHAKPGELFPMDAINVHTMHTEKRQSCEERAKRVSEIVATDAEDFWIVWCDTDYEADQLIEFIPDADEIRGSMPEKRKEKGIADFAEQRTRIFVSKPEIAGLGLNLQHCCKMVFVGLSYSFERFYQAVRRCWRFGQKRPVDVWIIQAEAEAAIAERVWQKRAAHEAMQRSMADAMKDHQIAVLNEDMKLTTYQPKERIVVPAWVTKKQSHNLEATNGLYTTATVVK